MGVPRKGGGELREKCLLPAGRSPGMATLSVACSHLQRPVRLGVGAHLLGRCRCHSWRSGCRLQLQMQRGHRLCVGLWPRRSRQSLGGCPHRNQSNINSSSSTKLNHRVVTRSRPPPGRGAVTVVVPEVSSQQRSHGLCSFPGHCMLRAMCMAGKGGAVLGIVVLGARRAFWEMWSPRQQNWLLDTYFG